MDREATNLLVEKLGQKYSDILKTLEILEKQKAEIETEMERINNV